MLPLVSVPKRSLTSSPKSVKIKRKSILARETNANVPSSSFKQLRKMVYEVANTKPYGNDTIPKLVIFLNMVMSPLIGILIALRASYDGRVSLIGISLRIVYFAIYIIVIYVDQRFERMERWSRLMPKLFGIVMICVQLIGVVPNYICDLKNILTCI